MEPGKGSLVERQRLGVPKACQKGAILFSLVGKKIPALPLQSTNGEAPSFEGPNVFIFYPYTGRPDHPDPPGWDNIAGAHGSTPQLLAFSAACSLFKRLNVKLWGVSFQKPDWQKEFVLRNNLRFPLLSDFDRRFSSALKLQTFRAGEADYLVRRTVITNNGLVTHDVFPVLAPDKNAQVVLDMLQS
jgi:peroxiredoxin